MTVDKEKIKAVLRIVQDSNRYKGDYRISHKYLVDKLQDFKDRYIFEFIPLIHEEGPFVEVVIMFSKGTISIDAWKVGYGAPEFLIDGYFDKEELLGIVKDLVRSTEIQQLDNLELFINAPTH